MRSSSVRAATQEAARLPWPGDRLRELARDVRRIHSGYNADPEAIAIRKDEIASELVRLARRVDGGRHHGQG